LSTQNGPQRPRRAGFEARFERILEGSGRVRRAAWQLVGRHALTLVTVAGLVGASLLVLSDFLDLYRIVDLRGQLVAGAKATRTGGDQHSDALLVIGIAAGAAALVARWTEQSLPALAVAALGAIALGIVLIGDLPDVTSAGLTLGPLEQGDADPAAGFWVELVGASVTVIAGLVLARLLALERARRRT
jgi:hypothetical protein